MSEIERAIEKKEYIERGALRQKALPLKAFKTNNEDFLVIGLGYLLDAPAADVEPVVRGEWIMDTDPDDGDCRCSNCRVCIDALHRRNHGLLNVLGYKLHTFYKYCPNCGAKMDGEKEGV